MIPPRILKLTTALLAVAAVTACSERDGDPSGAGIPPVLVELQEVQPEVLLDVVDFVGQLDAEASVVMKPEIDGVVESIEFEEGQQVKQGDVLIRLNSAEQRARLREMQAEQRLKREVYDRTQKLKERDISSAAQLDRAAAELERERARVALAQVELERTVIRAPFDGVVGNRLVQPGARVEPDDALVQIDAVDRLKLTLTFPEVALTLAQPGVKLEFSVVSLPGETFPAEVYFVSPTFDPLSRRLLVQAWVPNAEHRLRPGQFANIKAELGRREAALLVPEASLVLDREGTFVWRVDDQDAALRTPVRTGTRVDGRVEIVEGLAAGDRVVIAGTNKVRPGARVRAAVPHSDGPVADEAVRDTAGIREADGEGS